MDKALTEVVAKVVREAEKEELRKLRMAEAREKRAAAAAAPELVEDMHLAGSERPAPDVGAPLLAGAPARRLGFVVPWLVVVCLHVVSFALASLIR